MARLMLNDELWSKLRGSMLQHRIYDKPTLRLIVEAMLYRMRVGCPWRDLPAEFGCWNSIYQQFNRWSSKAKLMSIFKDLVHDPDLEWQFIDGSIVRAHQHSSGAMGIEAARREKRFKNWRRQWKINLIEELNPEWRDLYEDICS